MLGLCSNPVSANQQFIDGHQLRAMTQYTHMGRRLLQSALPPRRRSSEVTGDIVLGAFLFRAVEELIGLAKF